MEQVNANTGFLPAVSQTTTLVDGVAVPYNHISRLADKLFGAGEIALDNIIADMRLEEAINERRIREASGQIAFLPQDVSSWVQRNLNMIVTTAMIGAVAFFALAFFRR